MIIVHKNFSGDGNDFLGNVLESFEAFNNGVNKDNDRFTEELNNRESKEEQ